MYKIRVILDTQKDVFRTILVNEFINLEGFHFIIAKSFGFDGQEMASFYKTDDKWNEKEEIPLFNMDENGINTSMASYILNEILPNKNNKLIYVYDFFAMWTFYVEVIEIKNDIKQILPKTILSVGEIPSEAPQKEFKAGGIKNDLEENFDEDFDFDEF